jgi:hypothetical protein
MAEPLNRDVADRLAEVARLLSDQGADLFLSNTARAHRAGTTHDWVVIYGDDAAGEFQYTVITAQRGPSGRSRVVAGRETECVVSPTNAAA